MHSYRILGTDMWEVYFAYGMATDGLTIIKTFREENDAARLVHFLNGGEGLDMVATVHRLLQKGS